MSKFLVSVAILFSLPAMAVGLGSWKRISYLTQEVADPGEFRLLQTAYPEQLGSLDPLAVESASISVTKLKYSGETTCAADDPRLVRVNISYGYCKKAVGDLAFPCLQSSNPSLPPPLDPCQN